MKIQSKEIPHIYRNKYMKNIGSSGTYSNNITTNTNTSSIDIIGIDDPTEPTDENVYSALNTDSKIEGINNDIIEISKNIQDKLSKTEDDTAKGKITFDNGIIVKNKGNEEEISTAFLEDGDTESLLMALNTIELQTENSPTDGFKYVEEFENYAAISNADGLKDKLYIDKAESKLYAYDEINTSYYLIAGGGSGSDTGHQYNIRIINNLDSKNIAVSKGDKCNLNFTFISQERYDSLEDFEDTGERGLCSIAIKNTANADYTVVKQFYVNSNAETLADVTEYLTAGTNNIMIKVTGEITEVTTAALVYTVTLTTLALTADNFKWWLAYMDDITIPFIIAGNISKKLNITVTGNDYMQSYEENIGTATYTETPYNYTIKKPDADGIYNITSYVSNQDGTLNTKPVSFNIICIQSGSQNKYVAINNVSSSIKNYSENNLFDYTVYDGGASTTDLLFNIKKDNRLIYESNEDAAPTQSKLTFAYNTEIETTDDLNFDITVYLGDSNTDSLITPLKFNVDNSSSYSSVSGASFYMNPRTRSNSQSNSKKIINEITGTEINTTWTNFNWGNDGWQTDNDGNKCLRIMANELLEIDYYPFKQEASRRGKTIEIDYLIDNVTDYDEPVIKMCTDVEEYTGLKITPDNVALLSQSLKNKVTQGINTDAGKRIRMTLVIMPTAYGNSNFNICIIYINGKKNREFAYTSNDYFANDSSIKIGSNYADIDIYGIRMYDFALTSQQVLKNYINWLPNTNEKDKTTVDNDVLDVTGADIDFYNTLDQYNVLVFDNTLPSYLDPNKKKGNLSIYFYNNPEKNVTISNVEASGQGTSSKKYFRWNTKYKIDKTNSIITHADGTTSKTKWAMVDFVPAASSFTGKKNFASSMQSHKMGSVNSVQDLYRELGLSNEAMETEKYSNARISVYQMPFMMFTKLINEEGDTIYQFEGEYTFGADKGDKYTFGYDTDLFPRLISIEGSDNSPLPTLFRVPWTSNMQYNEDEEAFQYNGQNCWDFDGGKVENINLFIPAYNLAYQCSNRILPFNGTLDELNSNITEYRSTGMEYWIAKEGDINQFKLFYYEPSVGMFIGSDIGEGIINLKTQLSDYLASDLSGFNYNQLNELFINARIKKFRNEASDYWDIRDAIFHRNWVEVMAGTDQRAKNTYPYCFGDGCKWKWRFDDMDTIFDTDNQGQPLKKYSVEIYDDNIWNGVTSNFWNLLDLAFDEEIKAEMILFLNAMETLGGVNIGDDYGKLFAFFKKYYLDSSQYFPATVVNADAKYSYETAKLNPNYTNDTDPMTQSLGDHYSAESAWISKRINYIMSKYSFGNFSANGNDTIIVRAAGDIINYQLTPAIDLYPNIANGTSIVRGNRTKAGETTVMSIDLGGSADQQNIIQGASWYSSIGDWHDKNVKGTMTVQGKRLQELLIGHKTEPVTISIDALEVKSSCKSLQKIMLSNVSTLKGNLDLSACTHLREIYADGTSLSQIVLPKGSLQHIEFPDTNKYLTLNNYPLLKYDEVKLGNSINNITDMFITSCPLMNPVRILSDVVTAQGIDHKLKRVRLTDFDEVYSGSDGVTLLDNLATITDGTYSGLDSDGIEIENSIPVLDGSITVNGNAYEDTITSLRNKFNKLDLVINGDWYVRFKDEAVKDIILSNWFPNQIGVTKKNLLTIGQVAVSPFKNTDITDFREMEYMTNFGCTNTSDSTFRIFSGCTKLKYAAISGDKYNKYSSFENCTNLRYISFKDSTTIPSEIFKSINSPNLRIDNVPNTVTVIGSNLGRDGKIVLFVVPDTIENLSYAIGGFTTFNQLVVGKSVTNMAGSFMHNGYAKSFYIKATTPPTLGGWGYTSVCEKMYVPIGCLEAYKTATNWSSQASKMVEYDFDADPDNIKPYDYESKLEKLEITYESSNGKCDVITYPIRSGFRWVNWSIIEGSEYAEISDDGVVNAKYGVKDKEVTIQAVSDWDNSIKATKTISVSFLGKMKFNGTFKFITPHTINENTKMRVVFETDEGTSGTIMGCGTTWNGSDNLYIQMINGSKFRFATGSLRNEATVYTTNTKYDITLSRTSVIINDTLYSLNPNSTAYTTYPIGIGCVNGTTAFSEGNFKGTLYRAQIYDGDILVADYVPVGNRLYDEISKTYLERV